MRRKGEDIRSLEKWLRPLVESKGWDYCVIWKLGDDPSRFIELVGCICGVCGNVKVEKEENILCLGPLCRDTNFQHPIRSKACEALAQFPAFMSLYAGGSRVHGEVVISNKPLWLTAADASADSEPSNEGAGTRVLVPISGGLIELFASKHIPKDQNMLELVSTQCNGLEVVKSETMTPQSSTNVSINEQVLDPLLEESMQKVPLSSFHSSIVIHDAKPIVNLSLDGTSISSNISADSLSLQIVPKQMIKSTGTKRASSNENVSKQGAASVFVCNKKSAKDNAKVPRSRERQRYHSKNLETERKRRNRIKDSLFTLRSLVPNITKMDRAAIVGDAIDYIKELESDERKLRQELKELEDEEQEQEKINAKLKSKRLDKVKKNTNSGLSNTTEIEVQVEVNQLTKREFLIVVLCEQKKGGFRRLMEALNVLSIRVIDANVTSLDGKMRNTLKVEANKDLQPKKLRDQLIKLISLPTESPTSRKCKVETKPSLEGSSGIQDYK